MKVYVVECCYDYEGCSLCGVFSSQERADRYIDSQSNKIDLQVTEVEVDELAADVQGDPK